MKRATCLGYLGAVLVSAFALSGCEMAEYEAVADPTTERPVQDELTEEAVPPRAMVDAPSRSVLSAEWELPAASPWLPYEKLTLPSVLAETSAQVSLPQIEQLEVVRLAQRAAERMAMEGLPPRTALFVDLPGAGSVAFGATLSSQIKLPVAIVPTFNNWPADNELVPAEATLAAMIAMPPRLSEDVAAPPVFLFDAWRLAYKEENIDEGVVDNRYMLTAADLPSAELLRAQGITQIVYVVGSSEIASEEDDLHDVFAAYEDAGILIYLVDLASLVGDWDSGVAWYVEARSHCFIVRPRLTVVHDPRFYGRSRGGFGGGHLLAVPGGHVHFGFASGG